MTTTAQFPESYSPSLIDAIERAFDAVWTTLYAHTPSDGYQSKEMKIVLSQTLVALAANGITNPQELRRKALETMALSVR
jgi:hypothetical protein